MSNTVLTSVIPIRAAEFSFYRERLDIRKSINLRMVQTIVVDDGSPLEVGDEIKSYCETNNFDYVRIESVDERFSLSRARNKGIDLAESEWIIQEDADVIYTTDFYEKIVEELLVLDSTPFNFLSVPVVYLNEGVSKEVLEAGSVDKYVPRVLSRLLVENPKGSDSNKDIQHYAPASAIFIARKKLFLRAGAYDEYFSGWGGEDRDLAFRFIYLNELLSRPEGFEQTKPWNLNDTVAFEGWRAIYRTIGDYLSLKGLYGYHIYHEQLPWRAGGDSRPNIDFAKEKAKSIVKSKLVKPKALAGVPPDIILGGNPHLVNSQVLSALKNPKIIDEISGENSEDFANWLVSQGPNSITMWNPYGTPWRLQVFNFLKALGANVIVGERGALPNTFYFDETGLCVDSKRYCEEYWNYAIEDEDQYRCVDNYIESIRFGDESLEGQAARVNVGFLRATLKIADNKKILFVPLQLSDDTVTTFFSEPERGYADYLLEIQKLANRLPRDWVLIYKNHPLARDKFNISGAFAANQFHINDLLEASDAVALFNSGTGLLAMAFNKPVFYYGKSFYAIDGVNYPFVDAASVVEMLENGAPPVDREKIRRFYSYLIEKFYSFAEYSAELAVGSATSMRSKLKSLHYRTLRIPGFDEVVFSKPEAINTNSILFDRYRFYWWHKSQQQALAPAKALAKPAAPVKAVTPAKPPVAVKPAAQPQPKAPGVAQQAIVPPDDFSKLDERIRKKIVYKLYSSVASPFMSERHAQKLTRSPMQYFADGKSLSTRIVRAMVVPSAKK